MMVIYKKAY